MQIFFAFFGIYHQIAYITNLPQLVGYSTGSQKEVDRFGGLLSAIRSAFRSTKDLSTYYFYYWCVNFVYHIFSLKWRLGHPKSRKIHH